jgi:hypothetical protein
MLPKTEGHSGGRICLGYVTSIEELLNVQLVMGRLFYFGLTFGMVTYCKINSLGCPPLQKISYSR